MQMSNRKLHLFLATCKQENKTKGESECANECRERSIHNYSGTCKEGKCTCLSEFLQSHSYSYKYTYITYVYIKRI